MISPPDAMGNEIGPDSEDKATDGWTLTIRSRNGLKPGAVVGTGLEERPPSLVSANAACPATPP